MAECRRQRHSDLVEVVIAAARYQPRPLPIACSRSPGGSFGSQAQAARTRNCPGPHLRTNPGWIRNPRRAATPGVAARPGSLAHARRLGDNAGMGRDDSYTRVLRVTFLPVLDGARPAGMPGWMSPVAPVVTQAAVGAGHWAAGRGQRAMSAWVSAAGYGLVAWGLGSEAPTSAEVRQNVERLQRDLLRKPGTKAPAATATQTPAARHLSRHLSRYEPLYRVVGVVIGVLWGVRHPRRLTVLAIASEAPTVVFGVPRVARAVQRRRPRIAAGSALVVAGSVARLRAASAEPLR